MEKMEWIKELVKTEQKIEETGIVDLNPQVDQQRVLVHETLQYLLKLKGELYDAANLFNELKTSPLGRVKIYGIAQTHADFMLFRNGYKMIFSIKAPGAISIRMNFIGTNYIPTPGLTDLQQVSTKIMEENVVEARFGAFHEIQWTYQGQSFQMESLVKHYMNLFIRESGTH